MDNVDEPFEAAVTKVSSSNEGGASWFSALVCVCVCSSVVRPFLRGVVVDGDC